MRNGRLEMLFAECSYILEEIEVYNIADLDYIQINPVANSLMASYMCINTRNDLYTLLTQSGYELLVNLLCYKEDVENLGLEDEDIMDEEDRVVKYENETENYMLDRIEYLQGALEFASKYQEYDKKYFELLDDILQSKVIKDYQSEMLDDLNGMLQRTIRYIHDDASSYRLSLDNDYGNYE